MTALHPDHIRAMAPARQEKPEDLKRKQLQDELDLIRTSCPTVLAHLEQSTEPVLGVLQQMAYQAGRREVYRWLRGRIGNG